MAASMRPIIESCNLMVKNIDLSWANQMQEIVNKWRPTWIDAIENITRATQQIANVMRPFQQLATSISNTISKINIPTVSIEEKEQLEEKIQIGLIIIIMQ